MTLTPPAAAATASPPRTQLCAMCSATSEEEQAVSVLTQGPCAGSSGSTGGSPAMRAGADSQQRELPS